MTPLAVGRAGPRPERVAILVAGMHRSGTSALSGVLGLLGAGLPATLMAGDANNAAGYFESLPIVAFHDAVLARAGTDWNGLEPIGADFFSGLEADREATALHALIDREHADQSLMVVKDPRICRLLPLWFRVLDERGVDACVVVPVRHPAEIAASLGRRDGLAPGHAHSLWLRHVLAAEAWSRPRPRVFVEYRRLLEDWRGVVSDIIAAIDLRLLIDDDAAAAVDRFVDASLRHNVAAAATSEPDLVRETFERLRALCGAEARDQVATQDFDALGRRFEEAWSLFGHFGRALETARAAAVDRAAAAERTVEETRRVTAAVLRSVEERCALAEAREADARRETVELQSRATAMELSAAEAQAAVTAGREALAKARAEAVTAGRLLHLQRARADRLEAGWIERRLRRARERALIGRSGFFAAAWYRARNPDVAAAGCDPLDHFLRVGWAEERSPGPRFDLRRYLDDHPDVAAAGLNPLTHYLRIGTAERRTIRPVDE